MHNIIKSNVLHIKLKFDFYRKKKSSTHTTKQCKQEENRPKNLQ